MTLELTVHYADEKTVEKYTCSDFPNIGGGWITLYLVEFGRMTINEKSVLKMESHFVK